MLNSFQHLVYFSTFLPHRTHTKLSCWTRFSISYIFLPSCPTETKRNCHAELVSASRIFFYLLAPPNPHKIVMLNSFQHLIYFSTFLPHRTHTKLSCRTCFSISYIFLPSCPTEPTPNCHAELVSASLLLVNANLHNTIPLHTPNCHPELVSASLLLVNANLHNTISLHTPNCHAELVLSISYISRTKTSG